MRRYLLMSVALLLVTAGITYSIMIWDVPTPETQNLQNQQNPNQPGSHPQAEVQSQPDNSVQRANPGEISLPPMPEELQINVRPTVGINQLILKRYYTFCKDTETETLDKSSPLLNLPRQELLDLYPGWQIQSELAGQLVLYREIRDLCTRHLERRYIGEKGGYVTIFYGDPGVQEKVFRVTEIPVQGFPLQIKAQLERGIAVENEQQLISVIEGLESYYGED